MRRRNALPVVGAIALMVPFVGTVAAAAAAGLTLPAVIGDHMVLQRETDVPIWGWADPGAEISVRTSWNARAKTVTGPGGRWSVKLPTPAAGGPHTITVGDGRRTVDVADVLIGEVWLCSGQSNMEWPVSRADDAEAEIAAADFPGIRLFMVPNVRAAAPRADCEADWKACSPATVAGFSAVGYSFGRDLHRTLDVPIGLISSDWGGTRAETWMSADALRPFSEFNDELATLETLSDPSRRGDVAKQTMDQWWDRLDDQAGGPAWRGIEFDDAAWKKATLPATLSGDLAGFDGLVYYRRTVEIPEPWAGKPVVIELGPIDDQDDVWLNGERIGGIHEPGRWGVSRRYRTKAGVLKAGRNVIAVRVLDTGGPGGVNGKPEQMTLTPAGGPTVPLAGEWRFKQGPAVGSLPAPPKPAALGHNSVTALHNGMIAPIATFGIRGAIWYQGEANRRNPARYGEIFPAMIADWRRVWGQGDFPFYFVQIAPFAYGGDRGQAPMVRESQRLSMAVPNTGMVVTADIGDDKDIHPTNKQEVGRRLALWARAKTYGERGLVHSGPLLKSMRVDGGAVRLAFDHVGRGLELRESRRRHFIVAGADKRFHPANAVVDGDTVVVSSAAVPAPRAVRYGWTAAGAPNLFNKEGLPASPFRTDEWDMDAGPIDNDQDVVQYRTKEAGFVDLFNGTDLTGWHNVQCADSTWRAKDGKILCSGKPTGVIRTDRQYENFVLEMEFRHLVAGGNAGLFVWSDPVTARGQPFTRSVEVQVMDGREADWYTSDGDIFPIHGSVMTPENGRGGDRAFPTEKRMNPSPMWNHYRVTCKDGSISLAVNGKVVTRGHDCNPRRGYICLESEGSPVEFRHLRIKELPPSAEPLSEDQVCDVAEGFVSLYNGVDFRGWKHGDEHRDHWTAADWRMRFDGHGPDLWSEKSYRDFVLICDWRWAGEAVDVERPVILASGENARDADGRPKTVTVKDAGDSGIYLRGNSKSQVNIWCWPIGSGEVYGYRTDGGMPPDVRAGVTPREVADAPIGRWNRFVITMKGEQLTVVLNGKTVIEDARLPGVPPEGPIALQRHGAPIEFANVYIKELK